MAEIPQRVEQDASSEAGTARAHDRAAKLGSRARELRTNARFAAAAELFAEIAAIMPRDWLASFNAGAALLEAQRLDDAVVHLKRSLALKKSAGSYKLYAHILALRGDMPAAASAYASAHALAPLDVDANWGLFEVLQLLGDNPTAVRHQELALAQRSLRTIAARRQPPRTSILELCIAGTFQANIPLDFILDCDHTTVHKLYLGEHPIPAHLPPYDIVFNTIADAPNAGPALAAAAEFIAAQGCPSLNAPQYVPLTSRHAVAERFQESSTVCVARTTQVSRNTIAALAEPYPFLIRPLDSHAGNDLAKIDDAAALASYLAATVSVDDFYVSQFIDYRNADGYYRKYRIVFVDGVAYPVHLAISPRWMIHYYNAAMAENQWMRDEEHAFMRDIDSVFGGTLAAGLQEIARAIPLDYFGIDCSVAADGRVLLFEASSAMIVHMRDPVDLYPYKVRYIPRIIRALEQLFDDRLQRGMSK
jgi:tetratricopeptide (TPR) repeat protein